MNYSFSFKLLFSFFIISLLFLTSCAAPIQKLTASDDYVGERVTVKGTVEAPLKIGDLSGYTIVDNNGDKLIVASEQLPAEGDHVRVTGTLKEGILGIGYYIQVKE